MEKKCNKCGQLKSIDDFYKHSIEKDGHTSVCKECIKSQVSCYAYKNLIKTNKEKKEWRLKNPKTMDTYRDKWTLNNPDKRKESLKLWRDKNKEKVSAQNKLRRNVRLGNIKKQTCVICGSKACAHHPDYSKPLDVIWLCQKHHREEHVRLNSL